MNKVIQNFIQLLYEGVYDKETTDLSRYIMNHVGNHVNRGMKRAFTFKVKDIAERLGVDSITVKVGFAGYSEPEVSGSYMFYEDEPGPGRIEIVIEVPTRWHDKTYARKQLSVLLPKLKNVIKHELEHFGQPAETLRDVAPADRETIEQIRAYYMNPAEVGGRVAGMYKQAKMQKRTLSDVFDDQIDEIIMDALDTGASDRQIETLAADLYEVWEKFARDRFPGAKLK